MRKKTIKRNLMPFLLVATVILLILNVNHHSVSRLFPAPIGQAAQLYLAPVEIMALMSKSQSPSSAAVAPTRLIPTTSAKQPLMVGWILDSGATNISSVMNETPGLNVLSPKWFHVDGPNGAISGIPERTIIQQAHNNHQQVWAVVDNGFNGSFSHSILQYQDQQDMLIGHIVKLAVTYHLDGINLDFEGLLPIDRWNYSRFVNELAVKLHMHQIQLSVDLPPDYVAGTNNGPYNHAAIAKAADYVVLMGYDEYWLGDPKAGPTASLPWVRLAVNDFLKTGVPANKLILGIPFYAEDWTVNQKGKVLSSIALSALESSQLVNQLHTHLVWNAKEGVYFTAYRYQKSWHEIWLENRRTLMLFAELARNDKLAGLASWYLGLESKATWLSVLHTLRSPSIID